MNIAERLSGLSDEKYRLFQSRLMPDVDIDTILGVRMPLLRKLARELSGTKEADEFLASLPHRSYDENNLHGLLLERIKDYDRVVSLLDAFLPYVDNWATCDIIRPKCFLTHKTELIGDIRRWLRSDRPFTVRFAIEMLMSFYLDGDFKPVYPEWVAGVNTEHYYVHMMVAWYFATALAKQYDAAVEYFKKGRLDEKTRLKAISKARESFRITPEQKEYLLSLR